MDFVANHQADCTCFFRIGRSIVFRPARSPGWRVTNACSTHYLPCSWRDAPLPAHWLRNCEHTFWDAWFFSALLIFFFQFAGWARLAFLKPGQIWTNFTVDIRVGTDGLLVSGMHSNHLSIEKFFALFFAGLWVVSIWSVFFYGRFLNRCCPDLICKPGCTGWLCRAFTLCAYVANGVSTAIDCAGVRAHGFRNFGKIYSADEVLPRQSVRDVCGDTDNREHFSFYIFYFFSFFSLLFSFPPLYSSSFTSPFLFFSFPLYIFFLLIFSFFFLFPFLTPFPSFFLSLPFLPSPFSLLHFLLFLFFPVLFPFSFLPFFSLFFFLLPITTSFFLLSFLFLPFSFFPLLFFILFFFLFFFFFFFFFFFLFAWLFGCSLSVGFAGEQS